MAEGPIPTRAEILALVSPRIASARAAWPALSVDVQAFGQWVLDRVAREVSSAADVTLAKLHVEDLWLAFGCIEGDPASLAAFEANVMATVPAALAHMRLDPSLVDDVKQAVRMKLLVMGDDGTRRISEYSGRGSLQRWVRAIAVRTALNTLRARKAEPRPDEDAILAQRSSNQDAEMAFIKNRYASEFRIAFRDAIAALPPDEQLLLRQHYNDRLTTVELATMNALHPVSVVRWLGRVRAKLATKTRRLLVQRLRLTSSELQSILQIVRSQMDASIGPALRDVDADPDVKT